VIDDDLVLFEGRGDTITFRSPDPHVYADRLTLQSPSDLRDLQNLKFDEILDYLEELGARLDVRGNHHMQWARDLTYRTSSMTKPLIDSMFEAMPKFFNRDSVKEQAERTVGLRYLNGWEPSQLANGTTINVRAFGARCLHIIPGNGPTSALTTLIRSAMLRSDCVIKTPSNGPFAAVALGRTMCELDGNHPITKHFAVAYWRGGDEGVEERLYSPRWFDKIVAWGGLASVRHVTRYIQPGLELIALDPKSSASVIGARALETDAMMREAALRLAVDVGTGNQEPCSAARVAYVVVEEGADSIERLNTFGGYVYQELLGLPEAMSTAPKTYSSELRESVDAIELQEDFYRVFGGKNNEGAVIVSQLSDPVDFVDILANRTVNIVPVASVADAIGRFTAYTQTVGIWPDDVAEGLLDEAPFYGVQRFVPLGYSSEHTGCAPHDGLELERRLCKWVVNQTRGPVELSYAKDRAADTSQSVGRANGVGTLDGVRK
jgi:hypothetical protein